MRYLKLKLVSTVLFLAGVMMLNPQGNPGGTLGQTTAQEKATSLRSQLTEIEAKQSELQTRLQALDEKLKPENIENSLAGIGSTHPEDLRQQRRRQLEIERNGVQAQLNLLSVSHGRLETAIAQADAEAYRQSAAPLNATPSASTGGPSVEPTNSEVVAPQRPRRARKKKARKARRTHHASAFGYGTVPAL
jgi:DNA repair exonuclease SbcCD ATPase subunit